MTLDKIEGVHEMYKGIGLRELRPVMDRLKRQKILFSFLTEEKIVEAQRFQVLILEVEKNGRKAKCISWNTICSKNNWIQMHRISLVETTPCHQKTRLDRILPLEQRISLDTCIDTFLGHIGKVLNNPIYKEAYVVINNGNVQIDMEVYKQEHRREFTDSEDDSVTPEGGMLLAPPLQEGVPEGRQKGRKKECCMCCGRPSR